MEMQAHKPTDSIEIIVVTTAEDLDATFNQHEPMQVVFQRALALVGGEGQPDQFSLELQRSAAHRSPPSDQLFRNATRLGGASRPRAGA